MGRIWREVSRQAVGSPARARRNGPLGLARKYEIRASADHLETGSPFHPNFDFSVGFGLLDANEVLRGKGFQSDAVYQFSGINGQIRLHSLRVKYYSQHDGQLRLLCRPKITHKGIDGNSLLVFLRTSEVGESDCVIFFENIVVIGQSTLSMFI